MMIWSVFALVSICLSGLGQIVFVQGAVIFDSFVPDNSSCTEPGGFGCLCDTQLDCNGTKYLECIDYKCYCLNPLRRMYDNKLQKCVSLVGSTCGPEKGRPRCVRNSECEDGRCACQDGFTVTSKLICMASYGEECGPYQCNIERGLACKSGICECLDNTYTYSAVTRSCFDPEGWVKHFITNWFDRSFFREAIIHTTYKIFHGIANVFFPRRFRFFGR